MPYFWGIFQIFRCNFFHGRTDVILRLPTQCSVSPILTSKFDAILFFSYSNANIDLKFETDDEPGAAKTEGDSESALSGIPPTFTEKPKIVPNEKGTLVTLKFKINADPKPEIQWFKGMDKIQDSAKFTQKYTALSANNEYEIALEIQDPSADDGGDYKCLVKNKMGQLQAKLNLNIEAEPAGKYLVASFCQSVKKRILTQKRSV